MEDSSQKTVPTSASQANAWSWASSRLRTFLKDIIVQLCDLMLSRMGLVSGKLSFLLDLGGFKQHAWSWASSRALPTGPKFFSTFALIASWKSLVSGKFSPFHWVSHLSFLPVASDSGPRILLLTSHRNHFRLDRLFVKVRTIALLAPSLCQWRNIGLMEGCMSLGHFLKDFRWAMEESSSRQN